MSDKELQNLVGRKTFIEIPRLFDTTIYAYRPNHIFFPTEEISLALQVGAKHVYVLWLIVIFHVERYLKERAEYSYKYIRLKTDPKEVLICGLIRYANKAS